MFDQPLLKITVDKCTISYYIKEDYFYVKEFEADALTSTRVEIL